MSSRSLLIPFFRAEAQKINNYRREYSMRKLLSLVLALCMAITVMAAFAEGEPAAELPTYTYHTYSSSLGNNWNEHTWETSADDSIKSYLVTPLADMQILDSENGVYQWVFKAATDVIDVTADHQDDLVTYGCELPKDKTAADVTEGYVYEIKLNPEMRWENGTPINADTYIYSMKQLLNPKMRNYRANLYYAGESAVAGGATYYNSGAPIYENIVPAYEDTPDYSYDVEKGLADGILYTTVTGTDWTLYTMSWQELHDSYGVCSQEDLDALKAKANPYGYILLDAETKEIFDRAAAELAGLFGIEAGTEDFDGFCKEMILAYAGEGAEAEYDGVVGCYKVDDYTIRYVCQTALDRNYFLTSCTSNWLVYEDLYEAGKDTTGTLVTTNYGTSIETTMSYGPYKLSSLQKDKQIVFVQNEEWYGYEKQEDGSLLSITPYEVDGEHIQRYQATSVVIDVMDDAAAKQAFLKGDLSEWTPTPDDLVTYSTSEQLYKVDETYTQSFFFNCGLDNLKIMDESKGNTNSVVLSNINFRKAMSLAIDRQEYVAATAGFKPAYSMLNSLYYYDVYNDPTSSYRNSEEAMTAIVNLYEVKYGEGTPYATLKDAYQSINGYNLTEAQLLFKKACEELVADGLYTEGDPIVIRIGFKKGALDSSDNKVGEVITNQLNKALEGTGFGKLTLELVGNINDRYGDTAKGEYAIGYGAWGGAAFYPFRNFQVYCDPDQYSIHEAGCWDPKVETLTLKVNDEDVTMTWQAWSQCMVGTGVYADADFATKLSILSQMEENYLKKYYRIPLAGTTACSMLAYQLSYYTEEYNIMYGFGGLELTHFNYTDAEWAQFVADQGGTLSYE